MQKSKKFQVNDQNLWLISYSDLITSILAVLVLVMSFSKIDIEKVDHANRLMKDESMVTLATLQKEYAKIIQKHNLAQFVSIFLDEEGLQINMSSTVQFDVNSAELDPKGIALLDAVFEKIIQDSAYREIIITGHTDSTGALKRNWELSSQRANAVLLYLIEKGLHHEHAHIVAYAANKPSKVAKDEVLEHEERLAKNRRVSILIGRSY